MLTLENDDQAVITFLTPNDDSSGIEFGDVDNNAIGRIIYNHATDGLLIKVANTNQAIWTDGELGLQKATTISTTATDLTLNPARNTILSKAAVMTYSEVTIASGAVTVTSNYHTIDTEGDASADDLDTISGAQIGQFLFLQAASSGRDVTVKHGTGNIYTRDGADVTMTSTSTPLLLLFDNGSNWRIVGGQAGL